MAVAVAAVLATGSVGANVQANLRAEFEAASGPAALRIGPGADGRAVLEVRPATEAVRDVPGVRALVPVLHERVEPLRPERERIAFGAGADTGLELSGRTLDPPELVPARLAAGRWPETARRELAPSDAFARAMSWTVGDKVTLRTRFGPVPFTVVGLLDSGYAYGAENGTRVALTSLETLQEAVHLTGRASRLEAHLAPNADRAAVHAALEARTGGRWSVDAPPGAVEAPTGALQSLRSGLAVVTANLLVLGAFVTYATTLASVRERAREHALLRTLGVRRREVRAAALLEAAGIGAVGATLGLALGWGLAWLLAHLNGAVAGFEVRTVAVPWATVAVAGFVGPAVAVAAAALPAWRASNVPPLTARRDADVAAAPERTGIGWILILASVAVAQLRWSGDAALWAGAGATLGFVIGVALSARSVVRPAALLLGPVARRAFGPGGALGVAQAVRNAGGHGLAIGTVVVATGMVVGVGGLVAGVQQDVRRWVDATVLGDLYVTAPGPFPDRFAEEAAALPELGALSGVTVRSVRLRGVADGPDRTVPVVLIDPARFAPGGDGRFRYLDGLGDDASGHAALRDPDAVLIGSALHARTGATVGDRVSLRTRDGFRTFRVGAVVIDFAGGGESVFAGDAVADAFGGGAPELFVATVADGVEPSRAAGALRAAFPELRLDATSNAARREAVLTLAERAFRSVDALLVLALLLAGLGVAAVLGASLRARARERALLRAIGLARSDLRHAATAEAVVVFTVGTGAGIGFGLMVSGLVTSGASALAGVPVPQVVPWRAVILVLAAAPLAGWVASLAPARQAARTTPLDGLRGPE